MDGNIQTTDVPTEEDMNKVRQIFDRGINAIVDASRLASQVQELSNQLDGLRADLDKVRQQNAWLDEQLLRVRQERDKANADATQARMDFEDASRANGSLKASLEQAASALDSLYQQIADLTRERDDAQLRVMELEDQVSKLKGKIEKFLALADEIDPPEEPNLANPPAILSDYRDPIPAAIPVAVVEPERQYDPVTGTYR